TTPQNLNAVCRKELNEPAADVIAEYMISEAKRLLLYTDNNVSEVAYTLNFNDTSHFIKYFKRHTGYTPQVFRSL
ncbi:AraC family transcriptional regulator, partial [Flavobacterium circumlabens]